MSIENAPGIGIHNEDRMIARVEKNGVRGFGPDAVDAQELFTELRGRRAEHGGERAAILPTEECQEFVELSGFLPEIARRPDQAGEFRARHLFHCERRQQLCAAQIGDGARGVFPVGVLDKNGPDDDFEWGASGPPVLLAVGLKQCIIIFQKDRKAFRGLRWHAVPARARKGGSRCAGTKGIWQGERVRHLFRKIAVAQRQVKNAVLAALLMPCSTVQVLANSQRWAKNALRGSSLFAMLSGGCTNSRERCGCLSV